LPNPLLDPPWQQPWIKDAAGRHIIVEEYLNLFPGTCGEAFGYLKEVLGVTKLVQGADGETTRIDKTIEELQAELVQSGLTPAQANTEAHRRFELLAEIQALCLDHKPRQLPTK
jgi:hypothetical protein